ncbi:MAG: HD domain-containing phosphohydrolase [Calditerrivibrio sp.]|uniref:HD domain-containing phosphohydrolase n=1 Tax=Calditerrivibrio sp. TaxID=2792612 RepID=UPI003D0B8E31
MEKDINILVVDDEDYIRDSIKLMFEEENYGFIEAENGFKALDILEKRKDEIDIVMTDLKMPEMDGITLLKIIKERYPEMTVIIITGYPSLETAIETLQIGADDYITKPFNVNDVHSKLRKALESKKLKREVALLTDIVSIYESARFLSSTLSQEEILLEITKKLIGEFGVDGFYVKLFNRKFTLHNADEEIITFLDDEFYAKRVLILFSSAREYEFKAVCNGKNYSIIIFPMYSNDGLWGIFAIYYDSKKKLSNIKKEMLNIYSGQISLALQNSLSFHDLSDGYMQTIISLSNAVDAKDSYTRGHSENVKKYSKMIVDEIGFPSEFGKYMTYAGLLHDIGKIGVDTYIILKPDRLSPEEFVEMKKHPVYGKEILEPIKFLGDVPYYVLFHHEKVDGTGYPYGLTDKEIPIGAKILSVADSYDAMTTDRSYRPRRTAKEAIEELDRCSGTQFDREIVSAFKSALKKGKII